MDKAGFPIERGELPDVQATCSDPVRSERVHAPERIPALDGLRAIAALAVLLFHFWQGGLFGSSRLSSFAAIGQTGVDLFFVLSGFLITRILLNARYSGQSLRAFFIRRCARILPLYYVGLVIYILFLPRLQGGGPTAAELQGSAWWWGYLQGIPLTLTHLPSFGPNHYWSLGVEEHFYLLWPFIVFYNPPKTVLTLCVATFVAAIGFRALFVYQLDLGTFYATPCRIDGLACGALLACLEREHHRLKWWPIVTRLAGPGTFCLGFILVVLWLNLSHSGNPLFGILKFSVINLFYTFLLLYLITQGKPKPTLSTKALENRLLRWIGAISYGIYVYHPAVISLVGLCHPGLQHWQSATFVILGTLAVSWLSHRFFESPILRLSKSCSGS